MHLVMEEHFNSTTLNTSAWHVQDGLLNRGSIYRASNAAVKDGALILRTIAENYTFQNLSYYVSSGAVYSTLRQRLGRWEASVKLPRPNESPSYTLHSSIWLNSGYSGHNVVPNTTWKGCADEIDVIEQYAGPQPPSPISNGAGSLHMHNAQCEHTPARGQTDEIWSANGDYTSEWTTFTLDWTEEWISMSINGKPVATYTNATVGSLTDVQPLVFTATVMERRPTLPEDVFPQEYLVDWVRIYAWDDDTV